VRGAVFRLRGLMVVTVRRITQHENLRDSYPCQEIARPQRKRRQPGCYFNLSFPPRDLPRLAPCLQAFQGSGDILRTLESVAASA